MRSPLPVTVVEVVQLIEDSRRSAARGGDLPGGLQAAPQWAGIERRGTPLCGDFSRSAASLSQAESRQVDIAAAAEALGIDPFHVPMPDQNNPCHLRAFRPRVVSG